MFWWTSWHLLFGLSCSEKGFIKDSLSTSCILLSLCSFPALLILEVPMSPLPSLLLVKKKRGLLVLLQE